MDVTGKIIVALPEQSGTSSAGKAWRKKEYVLETQENFPRKICFTLFGERVEQYPNLAVGQTIKLYFDIESREYNGRWFTNINAWKIEDAAGAAAPTGTPAPEAAAYGVPNYPAAPSNPAPQTDDLPF